MIKLALSGAVLAALALAACGGGPAATPGRTTGGAVPTITAGTLPTSATLPSLPTGPTQGVASQPPAPAPGGAVVNVTLSGGPDAGTYTATGDPLCSSGLIGEGAWGVQYSVTESGPEDMSSFQLIAPAEGQVALNVRFQMTVTIGPFLEPVARNYEVKLAEEDSESSGTGSAEVTDNGSTAVIHATGTTADGVGIDATVNCPSVNRF